MLSSEAGTTHCLVPLGVAVGVGVAVGIGVGLTVGVTVGCEIETQKIVVDLVS
jgi:hypothetical protein